MKKQELKCLVRDCIREVLTDNNNVKNRLTPLGSQKSTTWESIKTVQWNSLSTESRTQILSNPRIDISNLSTPLDRDPKLSQHEEWLGYNGSGLFYINTEGYDYPRYVFKIVF